MFQIEPNSFASCSGFLELSSLSAVKQVVFAEIKGSKLVVFADDTREHHLKSFELGGSEASGLAVPPSNRQKAFALQISGSGDICEFACPTNLQKLTWIKAIGNIKSSAVVAGGGEKKESEESLYMKPLNDRAITSSATAVVDINKSPMPSRAAVSKTLLVNHLKIEPGNSHSNSNTILNSSFNYSNRLVDKPNKSLEDSLFKLESIDNAVTTPFVRFRADMITNDINKNTNGYDHNINSSNGSARVDKGSVNENESKAMKRMAAFNAAKADSERILRAGPRASNVQGSIPINSSLTTNKNQNQEQIQPVKWIFRKVQAAPEIGTRYSSPSKRVLHPNRFDVITKPRPLQPAAQQFRLSQHIGSPKIVGTCEQHIESEVGVRLDEDDFRGFVVRSPNEQNRLQSSSKIEELSVKVGLKGANVHLNTPRTLASTTSAAAEVALAGGAKFQINVGMRGHSDTNIEDSSRVAVSSNRHERPFIYENLLTPEHSEQIIVTPNFREEAVFDVSEIEHHRNIYEHTQVDQIDQHLISSKASNDGKQLAIGYLGKRNVGNNRSDENFRNNIVGSILNNSSTSRIRASSASRIQIGRDKVDANANHNTLNTRSNHAFPTSNLRSKSANIRRASIPSNLFNSNKQTRPPAWGGNKEPYRTMTQSNPGYVRSTYNSSHATQKPKLPMNKSEKGNLSSSIQQRILKRYSVHNANIPSNANDSAFQSGFAGNLNVSVAHNNNENVSTANSFDFQKVPPYPAYDSDDSSLTTSDFGDLDQGNNNSKFIERNYHQNRLLPGKYSTTKIFPSKIPSFSHKNKTRKSTDSIVENTPNLMMNPPAINYSHATANYNTMSTKHSHIGGNISNSAEWERLLNWLESIGMSHYAPALKAHGFVKLSELELLSNENLIHIGVQLDSDRIVILGHINEFSRRTNLISDSDLHENVTNKSLMIKSPSKINSADMTKTKDSSSFIKVKIESDSTPNSQFLSATKINFETQYDSSEISSPINYVTHSEFQINSNLAEHEGMLDPKDDFEHNNSGVTLSRISHHSNDLKLNSSYPIPAPQNILDSFLSLSTYLCQANEAANIVLENDSIHDTFLLYFRLGNYEKFSILWNTVMSKLFPRENMIRLDKNSINQGLCNILNAKIAQDFYVYLYFAIYELNSNLETFSHVSKQRGPMMQQYRAFLDRLNLLIGLKTPKKCNDKSSDSIMYDDLNIVDLEGDFFLETIICKHTLWQSKEFVLFCAIAFVPQPRCHPLLQHMFQSEWISSLQNKLSLFLQSLGLKSGDVSNSDGINLNIYDEKALSNALTGKDNSVFHEEKTFDGEASSAIQLPSSLLKPMSPLSSGGKVLPSNTSPCGLQSKEACGIKDSVVEDYNRANSDCLKSLKVFNNESVSQIQPMKKSPVFNSNVSKISSILTKHISIPTISLPILRKSKESSNLNIKPGSDLLLAPDP